MSAGLCGRVTAYSSVTISLLPSLGCEAIGLKREPTDAGKYHAKLTEMSRDQNVNDAPTGVWL